MKFFKKHWLTFLLLAIIFLTRLLIINPDALQFWADESRYPILVSNFDEAMRSGNYFLPIKKLFNVDARPGAGLFYYPSAILDWMIPGISFVVYYNLVINILSYIFIFLILKKIIDKNVAVLATLLVTLSTTSLIYMRHTLPYDIALFLLLLGLFAYIYFQKSFIFGLFAGLSFLTYPSYYYYLFPIPFILILYKGSFKPGLLFGAGISFVLIFTQIFSVFISSNAYFQLLQEQSGGVTAIFQGDYIPAISYIAEYILATDGFINLFLTLAIFPALFFVREKKRMIFFAVYLILVIIILELFSHILQKHVLYGRTVRPLYLLLLGFSAVVLERFFKTFKNKGIYYSCITFLLVVSTINWYPRFIEYKNLTYPKQFQQKARDYLNLRNEEYEIEDALFVNYWNDNNPDPKLVWHFFKPGKSGKYYTMNAWQTFPYYGNFRLERFCNNTILLKEPHIQYIFKPARFEGYKKDMRDMMDKDPLYYQLIYCK